MLLVLASLSLFSIGFQVFVPYQMIYMNNYLNMSKSLAGTVVAIPILISMILAIPAGKLADRGHGSRLAFISPFLACAGLVLLSFSTQIYQIIITGSLIYTGFVVVTLSISAWVKNLMPEDSRGQFEGVRMIFNVALPMIIGPAIGSYLITNYGIPMVFNGESGFIPTPLVLQTAGVLSLTAVIPMMVISRNKRKQIPEHSEESGAVHRGQ